MCGKETNISNMQIFECAVYIPISPQQRTCFVPRRNLGIYISYESPSILKYLKLIIEVQFIARYIDCIFDEDHFSILRGDKSRKLKESRENLWNVKYF